MRDVTLILKNRRKQLEFLLTRPMRDVTISFSVLSSNRRVSTHTPHAGRDLLFAITIIRFSFLLTRPMRDVTMYGGRYFS